MDQRPLHRIRLWEFQAVRDALALVRDELARARPPEVGLLAGALGSAAAALGALFGGAVAFGLFLGIAGFTAVCAALAWPRVLAMGHDLIPTPVRARTLELLGRMDAAVSGFVRGRLITAALLAVVYMVGWSIVGVPYALVLGLAIGVLSLVPYLSAVGLPLAWLLVFLHENGAPDAASWYQSVGADGVPVLVWWKVLLLPAIVNCIAQSLDDYVLTPLIQGRATELHPVVIMVAVIAGGQLAGLYGMLLAVPAAACAKILLAEVALPRLRAWGEGATGPRVATIELLRQDGSTRP
jgi:predicted PurR-regulated permease PerM